MRGRVTDLTPPGHLLGKGSPNNKDSDGDREPDRLRFTLVSVQGVAAALLKSALRSLRRRRRAAPGDFACTVIKGYGVGTDGVTHVAATCCTLAVVHAP